MKPYKWLSCFLAACLTATVISGCNPQSSSDSSSATSSTTSSQSSDVSSDINSDVSSEDTSSDPENASGENNQNTANNNNTAVEDNLDDTHTDKDDTIDKYPTDGNKPSDSDGNSSDNLSNKDWTTPTVPITTVSKSELATLANHWNGLEISKYKETFDSSVASAEFKAESAVVSKITAALSSGTPALQTQKDKTGWNMDNGGTVYLDLSSEAKSSYADRRVAILVDYYSPRNTTALKIDVSGSSKSVMPTANKDWNRGIMVVDIASLNNEIDQHDIKVSVTNGSAVVGAVRVMPLDKSVKGVDNVFPVTPVYGSDRATVIAVASVKQFGAIGDGKVDDTAAFQAAVDYAGNLGGGSVYVPEGHYAIAGQLTLPANVALVGELDMQTLQKSKKVVGTVLDLYYGKNDPNGKTAIVMSNGSSVQYLALWYPEQQIVDGKAIPYSYTLGGSYVTGGVSYGVDIENIALVNSYNGMKFGPKYNVLETIRNVYGTPLNNGFIMDSNADLARIEGVYFSPSYWANSGLKNAPDQKWIFNCTFHNAIAFISERIDWTYMFDLAIDGYHTGMLFRFSTGSVGNGASNGSLYNLDIYDCYYGIDIAYMNQIGLEIANSRIYSSGSDYAAAIRAHSGLVSTLALMDCELGATGNHVIYSYKKDTLTLSNCTLSFIGNTAHGAAIYSYAGAVSATELKFRHVITEYHFGKDVPSARLLNCESPIVRDKTGGNVIQQTDKSIKVNKASSINLNQAPNHKPTGKGFVDMTEQVSTGAEISTELQNALNSLKSTGGIVYLPAGSYRLDNPITIPSGVEQRGAIDAPVYNTSKASIIKTNYAQGNEKATALITMQERAGLVGISFDHDQQDSTSVKAYPYVIRGNGSDIYVRNVSMNSCYNGIDFATYRCDRHNVQSFSGVILNQGIVVGGGSQNGVIRDVLVNPVYWSGRGTYNDAMTYALKDAEGIVIGDSNNQLLYSTFYYAAEKGLVFRSGCKNLVSITHGTDCADLGMYAEGNCGTIELVNYQTASWTGKDVAYVATAESFTGTLNIHGMLGWGGPNIGLNLQGGTVNIRQCKMVRYGSQAVNVGKANVTLIGMHLYQDTSVDSPLIPNLILSEQARSLVLGATIFDNEPAVFDSSDGALNGPDAELIG